MKNKFANSKRTLVQFKHKPTHASFRSPNIVKTFYKIDESNAYEVQQTYFGECSTVTTLEYLVNFLIPTPENTFQGYLRHKRVNKLHFIWEPWTREG